MKMNNNVNYFVMIKNIRGNIKLLGLLLILLYEIIFSKYIDLF